MNGGNHQPSANDTTQNKRQNNIENTSYMGIAKPRGNETKQTSNITWPDSVSQIT